MDGVGFVFDFNGEVEVFEDAFEADEALGDFDLDVTEAGDGAVEAEDVGGEGDDGADGKRAFEDEPPADPVDEGGADGGGEADGHEEPASDEGLADADVANFGVGVAVAGDFVALAAKNFDEQRAIDAEGFVDDGAHVGVVFHALAADFTQDGGDAAGGEHEEGNDDDGEQGEPPFDGEHDGEGGDEGDEVSKDAGQGAGDGGLCADDVVVEAGDDFSCFGVGKKSDGHAREVFVELLAQVVDDAFSGAGTGPAVEDADQFAEDRQADEGDSHPVKPGEVAVGDDVINEVAEEEGGDQAKNGRDQDGDEDSRHKTPVGTGISEDTAEELPVNFWFFFGGVVANVLPPTPAAVEHHGELLNIED